MNNTARDIDSGTVNPFLSATADVFKQLFGCELTRGSIEVRKTPSASNDVAVIIGVSGETHTGVVVFSMKNHTARKMVSVLDPTLAGEHDKGFADALGEIANIVCGNAMTVFNAQNVALNITTPSVIIGEAFEIRLLEQTTLSVGMNSPFGVFEINVAIKNIGTGGVS